MFTAFKNCLVAACCLAVSVAGRAVGATHDGRFTLQQRALNTNLEIVSGATWTSPNTGNHVQAHGAGYILVNGLYYMIGENKTDGASFQSVTCYSSPDLVSWTFVNNLLTLQSSGDLGPNRIVERPKVIYNAGTKQYVMYMHIDDSNYSEAKVGVATSSSRPNGLRIDQLSSDYLSVSKFIYTFKTNLKAPAMIKQNGIYYLFGSYLTGWNFNDNQYTTATSLSGPWSDYKSFAPSGSHTFDSQTTYVLQTPKGVMYMGDRWYSQNFIRCTYITLPMSINGTTVTMNNDYEHWLPSTFQSGPALQTYGWSSGTVCNGAKSVSCSGCSNGNAAGYIGGPSNGALTFSGVFSSSGAQKTVQIVYENGDAAQRYAKVTVNGGTPQRVAFIPTGSADATGVSVLNVALTQRSSNTIKIEGLGDGSYGPHISQISIPQF